MRTLNVALIGQRFMGRAHSNAWSQVGRFFDLRLRPLMHTAAGRDASALTEFAERWGWSRHTTRWRDLAKDPEIDLVDVCTPNDQHRAMAVAMLKAGKHVACEKPLAGTLADARAMRDAARRREARTFVWFNYRRCPAVALAWQLMRKGRLGRVRHVRARYLQSWGGKGAAPSWRFRRKVAGSGAHGDLNAHIVDLARFLTGDEIVEIHGAAARTFTARRDVDDALLFLAGMRGGAVASFEASRVATGHLNDNGIEINADKGALRFDFEDMNVLQVHDGRGWKRVVCTDASDPYVASWWPEGHVLGYEHGFTNMAADILAVLAGRRPVLPLPDFADAYETQRVLHAALLSVRRRRAVRLSEVR